MAASQKRIKGYYVLGTDVFVITNAFRIRKHEHSAANRQELRGQEKEYEYGWQSAALFHINLSKTLFEPICPASNPHKHYFHTF